VVVEQPQVVVGWYAVLVVAHSLHVVVVVVEPVVVVELEVVEADDVVVPSGTFEPQNCTLETSGVFPCPTCGKPSFEKDPVTCGGEIE
jgi:hypothetical protein